MFAALGSRDPLVAMSETPETLRQITAGVSRDRLSTPEAPGKWSMIQVVQHLADTEIVGAIRFRMTLAHDRPLLAGYDQDLWAGRLRYNDAEMAAALDQFTSLRRANLRLLHQTTATERERVGIHAERGEESVAKMIRIYAGHDQVHLRQLARIKSAIGA
jgi:hypothetical protein